jgi:hypothetical protein
MSYDIKFLYNNHGTKNTKINWAIQADNVTIVEEKAFLSNFGELQKTGLHTPNKENNINFQLFNQINSKFPKSYLRLMFNSKQKLMKVRLQGTCLEIS